MMNVQSVVRGRIGGLLLALGLGAASLLGGCVGQSQYDKLYETNNSLSARNAELTAKLAESQQANDLMRRSIGSGEGTMSELQKRNMELQRQLDQAMADYKSMEGKMAGLTFGALDPATSNALETLAAQFPDLIKYDAASGMLRFASDLTFDSGSATVKDNAKSALSALGKVLTSPSATGYEVVVEGHTDSQKISGGTSKLHPTNRYLSAHRAIAVIDELGKMGVPSDRMMAAGWGEYHPLVQNTPSGNTPQNRRVEIFLAKAHGTNQPAPSAPTTTPKKTTKAPKNNDIDITK